MPVFVLQPLQAWGQSRHDAVMLHPADIRYLVVHCSDTPDEDGLTASDIHAMHLGFGWDGAGYHAIITRDGICHPGRPEYWQGAHVKGRNHDSVGVCLIGRHNFTKGQFAALESLLLTWSCRYPNAEVVGHRDIQETHKTCPNFDAGNWWADHNPLAQKQAMVRRELAPIYQQPPSVNHLPPAPETEALMAEKVTILNPQQHNGYVEIELATDGYKGWIEADCLCCIPETANGTALPIRAAACVAVAAPDVKSAPIARLSMGALVWAGAAEKTFTQISLYGRAGQIQTGYLPSEALSPPSDKKDDWPAYAERFLGAPYKWGGRSAAGLDCSALIQLALAAAGYKVPRDSGPQQAFMTAAAKAPSDAFQQFQRGDIIFWNGHVGICVTPSDFLHANAHHSRVAIEPIAQAIRRIAATDGPPTRHIGAEPLLKLLDRNAGA